MNTIRSGNCFIVRFFYTLTSLISLDIFVIETYKFPSSQVKDVSLFTNIEVDIKDSKGRNTFAYITDTTAYKLIVYDFKNDESWVVDQAYFYPYPNKAHFKIKGVNFDLMDGILGLALGNIFGIIISEYL